MADFTVFYSWQSDLPRKRTRDVIHNAAADAVARVDAELEDAPRFDHDTDGIAGAPEIARTIFEKIDHAGMVIADLSFVGATTSDDPNKRKKVLPNANVLLELGYAAAKVGWERIILVMNTAFGKSEELPFDLIHRRFPITFDFGPDDRNSVDQIQAKLSTEIEGAIKLANVAQHAAVLRAVELLDVNGLQWMHGQGKNDAFHAPQRTSMGEVLQSQQLDYGLVRLIDLGLLKCDIADKGAIYAYHWTYLGKLVLKHIGIR